MLGFYRANFRHGGYIPVSATDGAMSNISKAKGNVVLFLGTTAAMCVATIFSWATTGVSSPGTLLAASLVAVFTGLTLASRHRVQRLEARQLA